MAPSGNQRADPNGFFRSFRPVLLLSQLCGLLPMQGTCGTNSTHLKFSWWSPRLLYTTVLFVTIFVNDYVSTKESIENEIRMDNFGSTMFYSVCLVNIPLFLHVAWKLPSICTAFDRVDCHFGPPRSIGLQVKVYISTLLLLGCIEYSCLVVLSLPYANDAALRSGTDFWEAFYVTRFGTENYYLPYSGYSLAYVFTTNVLCTLNWNVLDFFLIAFSLQLSSRLAHLHEQMEAADLYSQDTVLWDKLAAQYNDLSKLTKQMDAIVSKMMIISYISNLYHLSLQLLRSIKIAGNVYQMAYFYFSLSYFILRMLTVSMCAAEVYDQGKRPKGVLFSLHRHTLGTQRFLHQVLSNDIHMTGGKFFVINRRFVFKLIGTIVTYEVFLLQVNALH